MKINSTRLGELTVNEEQILEFPQGIPGFPAEKKFAFLPYQSDSIFAFLQSLQEADLTFIIVEPFNIFSDYRFEISDEEAVAIGFTDQNPSQIFNIVTVPQNVDDMTANLLAPLIVNLEKRQAWQIVLEKMAYTTRHRLLAKEQIQQ